MPAFTFEKLTPPAPRAPAPPVVRKRPGVMVQMLKRFAGKRARRVFFRKKAVANSDHPKPQD
jgi:hypothetical protein